MNNSIQTIPLINLALAFLPVSMVLIIVWKWKLGYATSLFAVFRMLVQLLLIGYFLAYIFETDSTYLTINEQAIIDVALNSR